MFLFLRFNILFILFILFDVTKIGYKHTLVKQIISIFA